MPPRAIDYIIEDEVRRHDEFPRDWQGVLEEAVLRDGANFSAESFLFSASSTDDDFISNRKIRKYLRRSEATRLVNVFRKSARIIRENRDASWQRSFMSKSQLNVESGLFHLSTSDRMSQLVGVGPIETMYSREQLQLRATVSLHCGLEAFINLETPDHRAVIIVMVDLSQSSKLGRIMREPQYTLLEDGDAIIEKWVSAVSDPYRWTCHAWFDCVMNNGLEEFRKIGCRPVVGSLGLGPDGSIWWEYGNGDWSVFGDFVSGLPTGDAVIDAHFWLEDSNGRVYDVIRPHVYLALLNSGHRLQNEKFPRPIVGETREELRAEGLRYIAAPRETQRLLFSLLMRQQESLLKSIEQSNPFFSYLSRHPQDV